MLDIKYRFTCGDSDLSEIIKKCQNIMTRMVVRALTSFHFNVFSKRFNRLRQYLVMSITKKVISYLLVLGQQTLIALEMQIFIKVFQFILKSLETF